MSRQVMSSKVKVDTVKLLEGVRSHRKALVAKYYKDKASYDKRVESFRGSVRSALEKALKELDASGKVPKERYGRNLEIPIDVDRPLEPTLDTSQVDRLIKTLEMASDESIAISADDAAYYLG